MTNSLFSQKIQHEPRKLFVETLNVPNNTRNMNKAFREFVKKNNIKRLYCFRDGKISSDITFDKNGNVIIKIENDNKIITKSVINYDEKNRVIKKSNYNFKGEYEYGYEYEFLGDTILTFRNPDRILKSKDYFIKDKNQKISIDYGNDQEIISKEIKIFDDNGDLKHKKIFSNNILSREFIYYLKDGERFEDEIFYPENGDKIVNTIKINNNDIFDKNGNKIINYSVDFKVSEHKYNSENRIISSDYYSKYNGLWKKEKYNYKNDTILIKKSQDYILADKSKTYKFIYNEFGLLEKVFKIVDNKEQIFEYKYQLHDE